MYPFCSCDFTGLETKRPNLLLGLAIVQKPKRPESLLVEIDEKKTKMSLSKDPMWIPKPPILYGSDNLEIFQPYDPATPANTSPPDSPPCPRSPSDLSCPSSVTVPPLSISLKMKPPVSSSAITVSSQVNSNTSSEKTPLQTILTSLFTNKKTAASIPTDGTSKSNGNVKTTTLTKLSGPMVDPIVQQYGQKLKVKDAAKEENDLDRPYDPEEEYPPTGRQKVDSHHLEKNEPGVLPTSSVDDDVAYDPEDETIFADIQGSIKTKPGSEIQLADSSVNPSPISIHSVIQPPAAVQSSSNIAQDLPTGTVVVSAATLTEQQRMLEELNKQIEEQKRQLKEQEEALRQQRETVGMFMAHFSVSDSLMSPPQKSLPLSQLSAMQSGIAQTESKTTDKAKSPEKAVDSLNLKSKVSNLDDEGATISDAKNEVENDREKDEAQKGVQENELYYSAGEIEDSDVEYDPEDESLFNEIFEDGFQGCHKNTGDISKSGQNTSHRGSSQGSYHGKKRRQSPKRRSRREKDRHRSPSRRSHRHSPSHSQRRRGRDRHRRSERDRSRHRAKDNSVQQGRHRRDHGGRKHSHGHRGLPSPTKEDYQLPASKQHRRSSPNLGKDSLVSTKNEYVEKRVDCTLVQSFSAYSCEPPQNVRSDISETLTGDLKKAPVSDHDSKSECGNQNVGPCHQAASVDSKIESTIPLRELDPPTRDSPQSPDPEPQFSKSSNIEKGVSVKTENISDYESVTCASGNDSKCLPNIRNLDYIALEVEGLDSKIIPVFEKQLLKTEEHLSPLEIPNSGLSVTTTAIVGGSIDQKLDEHTRQRSSQSLNLDSSAIDCPNVKIKANMGISGFGRGQMLDSNNHSDFDATHPGKKTTEQGQNCWKEVKIAGPGSNKNEFRNPPCSLEDNGCFTKNAFISHPGFKDKITTCNSDMRPADKMQEFKRPDFSERGYMMHGQFLGNMDGPQGRDDRGDTYKINSRGVIGERGPNHSEGDMYEQQERNEMHQKERTPNPNSVNQNFRGQEFYQIENNNRNPPRQDLGLGPYIGEPEWLSQENKMQGDFRNTIRKEPCILDEGRANYGDRHDRKRPECPVIIGQDKRGIDVPMRNQRTPEGPGFTQPAPNRTGCDLNRRGPGDPDFRRLEPPRRAAINDNNSALGVKDPSDPNVLRHNNDMRHPSNRRGPAGPNVNKQWLDNQGPNMGVSVTRRKGLLQSDFSEPLPEEEGFFQSDLVPLATETGRSEFKRSGPFRRGKGGPERMMRENDCRDIPVGSSLANDGGPSFRGPGFYRKDSSLINQDFTEPWHDGNTIPMCELQPEWEEPRCPEFRGTGPDCLGNPLKRPRLERTMPGTNSRVSTMTDVRLRPGDPNFRGPEPKMGSFPDPENTAASNDWPVHEGFSSTNDQRGPDFHREERKEKAALMGPGSNKRQRSPNSRGGSWRDASIQGQGPNRRGIENQHKFVHGPHTGPPVLHYSGADMEAPDFERREVQEADAFRGLAPERTGGQFERTGRGFPAEQLLRPPLPERRPLGMDNQGFNIRGLPSNVRSDTTPFEVNVDNEELTEPDFMGSDFKDRGLDFGGQEPDSLEDCTSYRGPPTERRAVGMEGPEKNWRRSGHPGHGNKRKYLDYRGPGPENDQLEGSHLGVSQPIMGSHRPEEFGPGRKVQRALGPIARHNRGPGVREDSAIPNRAFHHVEDQWPGGRGPKHETFENDGILPRKEWPGPDSREQRPFFDGPCEFQQHSREEFPLDWREPGNRVPRALQERPNIHERGPGEEWGVSNSPFRNEPHLECPGTRGRQLGNKWREPNREPIGTNRMEHGPFFREPRGGEHVNSAPNKRVFEMEDIHQGDPRSTRFIGPECTNTEGPGMRRLMPERASPCFNGPNQGLRFQCPTGPRPPRFSGPQMLSQNSDSVDKHHNQQIMKPHKHRGSLLPTPKGVFRFPNRTLNNSKVFKRNPV